MEAGEDGSDGFEGDGEAGSASELEAGGEAWESRSEDCAEAAESASKERRGRFEVDADFEGRPRFLLSEARVGLEDVAFGLALGLALPLPGRGGEKAGLGRFVEGMLVERVRCRGVRK